MQARLGSPLGLLFLATLGGCTAYSRAPEGGGADYACETTGEPAGFGGFLHPKARAGYGGDATPAMDPAPEATVDAEAPFVEVPSAGDEPRGWSARGRRDHSKPARVRPRARQLTAGEHRDLDDWQQFLGQGEIQHWARSWGFDLRRRIPVVVSADGVPVTDATVKLLSKSERVLWEARTDNHGRAELFPDLFAGPQGPETDLSEASLVVESGEALAFVPLAEANGTPQQVELSGAAAPDRGLDLMLMVDATGSMADELQYLQSELTHVLERVRERQSQRLRLRTSVGVYRDHGDAYVVRSFPFTEQVSEAQRQLDQQHAAGGGDMPEAVDEALETALTQRRWSPSARARLLFLVLDAPPHPGSPAMGRLRQVARQAAAKGIRIVPVVASGSDKRNEGLMRSLAATSGGTFTFLTDHSGIGGRHLAPSVSKVKVELLADMLVRLIDGAVQDVGQVSARPTAAF